MPGHGFGGYLSEGYGSYESSPSRYRGYGDYGGGSGFGPETIDAVKDKRDSRAFTITFFGVILALLVLMMLVGLLISYIGPPIESYLRYVLSFMSAKVLTMSIAVLGAVVVPTAGYLLYLLRQRTRSLYGAMEIASGVFLAYYTIQKTIGDTVSLTTLSSSQMIVTLTALLSSVYIAVRGLDNIGQARQNTLRVKRLISAVEAGDDEAVRWLINSGVSPDVQNKSGDTPLIIALRKELTSIVQYLLTRSANFHQVNRKGESARSLVAKSTNQEIKALFKDRYYI